MRGRYRDTGWYQFLVTLSSLQRWQEGEEKPTRIMTVLPIICQYKDLLIRIPSQFMGSLFEINTGQGNLFIYFQNGL